MKTEILKIDKNSIDMEKINYAASVIKKGGTVCFPTETVYGLGANGLLKSAAEKIYAAKGRPSDNPLILHISDLCDAALLVKSIPGNAYRLAEKFWPGPLTMIFEKTLKVPDTCSGGLPTVALRNPSHPVARALIKASGVPIAAPSANISGRPSPTSFSHVLEDLNGKVDVIIDGGDCTLGVESTVLSLAEDEPVILRPGSITEEMLLSVLPYVKMDKNIITGSSADKPKAPGMKYKHYSPKAEVFIVSGERDMVAEYINSNLADEICVIAFDENVEKYNAKKVMSLGSLNNLSEAANRLFACLRMADTLGFNRVYCEDVPKTGVGFAVYNRLQKAAGNKIIKVGE